MTRCAVAMARVRIGELDLGRVARLAERSLRRWIEVVRTMARRAGRVPVGGRVGHRDIPVTRRTRRHDGCRCHGGMGLVACDAGVLRAVLHGDVRMASFAGCGRGSSHVRFVRGMAARALGMLGLTRRERGFLAVAAYAGLPRGCDEIVGLVTPLARRVAGSCGTPRLFVTSCTRRERRGRSRVRLMAIRAGLTPDVRRVLGRAFRVAGRAVGDDRWFMRCVAGRAANRGVVHDVRRIGPRLNVTIAARRNFYYWGKAVASEATLRISGPSTMAALDLLRVTGLATGRPRVLEADMGEVVASAALDPRLVHMGHMALTLSELRP
jgi:hypothetical protein